MNGLALAKFQKCQAARFKQARQQAGQLPIGVQSVGTAIQGGVTEAASSSASFATTIASPTVLKFLNVGDYVEVWAWQTSGGNLNTTAFADQACSLTVYFAHS